MLDLTLQLRRRKIRTRITRHFSIQTPIEEFDYVIALITEHILLLNIPEHRNRRSPIVTASPKPVHLLEGSAPVRSIGARREAAPAGSGAGFSEFPGPVDAGAGDRDGDCLLEALEGPDDEGPVGPWAS